MKSNMQRPEQLCCFSNAFPGSGSSLGAADWRDAELMQDIEAATGQDLGSGRVGKKGKGKKKYPNLSDLKQSVNTPRSRLEKKVFNK